MNEAIHKGAEHSKDESSTCSLLPALYDRVAEDVAAVVAVQHLLWMLGGKKNPKSWSSATCA